MYSATEPSLVTRVAFFAATETPFLRRTTTAASRSPLASVRACLQSIMGAPVFSRSSLTCAAEIFTVVALISNDSHFLNLVLVRGRFSLYRIRSTGVEYLDTLRRRIRIFQLHLPAIYSEWIREELHHYEAA